MCCKTAQLNKLKKKHACKHEKLVAELIKLYTGSVLMLRWWWHKHHRHQQSQQRTMERNVVIRVTCLFLLCIHYVFAFNHLQPQHFHRRQFYSNDDDVSINRKQDETQPMILEKDLPLFHSWHATNESRIFYIRSGALGNEWITATTEESSIIDNDLLHPVPDINLEQHHDDDIDNNDDEDELDNVTDLYNSFHPVNNKQHIFLKHNNKHSDKSRIRQNKHHGKISYNKFNDLNIINDTNLTRSNVRHIASRYRRQHSSNQIGNANKRNKGKRRKKRLRSVPDLSFINKHYHHHHQTIHWPVKKEAVIEGKHILLVNLILTCTKKIVGHR